MKNLNCTQKLLDGSELKHLLAFLWLFLGLLTNMIAHETKDTTKLYIDLPILDLPYQKFAAQTTGNFITGYANPSMNQALSMSNNLYQTAHWAAGKYINTKSEFLTILLRYSAVAGFDAASSFVPFGSGWLHEEYHRAILTKNKISSFNDINTFPFGQSVIAVRKVLDEDLIRLSNTNNLDFKRMMVAGNEGQYYQMQSLQKLDFFYQQEMTHIPFYWMSTLNSIVYVNQSASSTFDDLVDEINALEAENIEARDFTGPDFTAWALALFNPDEPYESRGPHPFGIGLNRYVKPSQLSTEARSYLMKQGNLQWLNLASTHLFGFPRIKFGPKSFGSLSIRHLLTPFGNDISADLFFQNASYNFLFSIHNYNNYTSSFGGIELEVLDKSMLSGNLLFSSALMLWVQPDDLQFRTTQGSLGGLMRIRADHKLSSFYPYCELTAKTDGWVMGNEYLERNLSVRVGLNYRLN